ncbi:putative NADH-ubiquinone oxidoreductase 20.8 kDa subunit [[Candida] railenensis]|uniref:NADH-ubiquinone oxidoreductase n=1 Tax=[Candida] railenensis TaxID=45579 RepID=A0A9P0QR66_9ASCO|nr:putative NADH-ubiquinone oxidoreductase 20.8 kDa subunit [[Candida] railenensis]
MVLDDKFIGRHQWENVEQTPMPKDIPDVDEVGATSAPLLSASYFIGAKCKPYNDDFMLCKDEKNGGSVECLKEGRRVTRCAIDVLKQLNKHCFDEFKLHYTCLEQENHRLGNCRKAEQIFNKCVFTHLNLEKKIPEVKEQIHLKESKIFHGNGADAGLVKAFLAKKEEPTN